MKKKFYVTTPIYYPNDIPHIGHAYTTIAGDILARWYKLKGYDVFFSVGTDEHGKKIADTAKKNGKSPKKFVDELVPKFKDAWKKLNIDYDNFIRTTDENHKKVVQDVLQKVYDKGDIYIGEYEGYYCTGCEAYFTGKDLVNGCCPVHKTKIEKLKEKSYFFKLSKYQKKLLELYKKNTDFISPKNKKLEVINRIKEGLNDLSISRTSFDWGIKLPFDDEHICYVWFDALLNYYSATREKGKEKFWPADVHLIGKDILWFHAVYWPAMLMSAGIDLPKRIFAHGWWTFDKEKISKSRGKVINVDELIKIAGVDTARYFLFRVTPFGDDGDFSEKALIERHNNELADKLGNLVSRVSGLIERNGLEKCGEKIPLSNEWKKLLIEGKAEIEVLRDPEAEDKTMHVLKIKGQRDIKRGEPFPLIISEHLGLFFEATRLLVEKHFETYEFDKALNEIFKFIDHCNWYIQIRELWKSKDKRDLYELKESILKIAELLSPFIPESAEKIKKQFSATKIKKGKILFEKIR
ncbi:MAG: methionine--tRNA ligase [Nanoarchaeota archaeon]|nr:methionine--tRNA ligase [Nanoarchaeota archaeon]